MKVCFFCTCKGQMEKALPGRFLKEKLGETIDLIPCDCLCGHFAAGDLKDRIPAGTSIAVAACSRGSRGALALQNIRDNFPGCRAELADIREGCLWQMESSSAHKRADEASAFILAAFARNERPQPAAAESAPMPKRVLVIGGGPAGMSAASFLAGFGAEVTLAERRPSIGGMLSLIGTLFPHMSSSSTLLSEAPMEGVRILSGTDVLALSRSGPLYEAQMKKAGSVFTETFASVIIAAGGTPVLPGKALRADELKGVISQMELDTLLSSVEQKKKDTSALPRKAVFVQCVHARTDEEPYCSAICCPTAVKNALRLKELDPEISVTVLNRQMVMPGIALEELYRKAMRSGVRFLHIDSLDGLRIEGSDTVEAVVVPARTGAGEERLEADRLVCSTPLRPAPALSRFAAQLGLRSDPMGFLRGHEPAHPLESDSEGVFICGSARWPSYAAQAMEQGRAAAVMAMRYLMEQRMPMAEICGQGQPAHVLKDLCSGCGRCIAACPHGACRSGRDGKTYVERSMCRSCGTCASVCPCGAAVLESSVPSQRELLALCTGDMNIRRAV